MNEAASKQPPFAEFLGLKITHVSPERVTAELVARDDLNNRFGIMHGGALMALADNLGGSATTNKLKPGQSTTTVESKTNFFAAVPIGDVAKAHYTQRRQAVCVGNTDATRAGAWKAVVSSAARPGWRARRRRHRSTSRGSKWRPAARQRECRRTRPSPPGRDRTDWQSRSRQTGGSTNTLGRPLQSTAPAQATRAQK